MDWRDYGYVIASNYRVKVITALLSHPKTPKQLSIETQIGITHVSRTIRELSKRELIFCTNPQDLKGKVYRLTGKGNEIAKVIERDKSKLS
jgi:DNA-binding MarR family transcriptional regulator